MARLLTCGFEVGSPATLSFVGEGPGLTNVTNVAGGGTVTPSIITATPTPRSGVRCYKTVTTGTGYAYCAVQFAFTGVVANTYFARAAVYISAIANSNAFGVVTISNTSFSQGASAEIVSDASGNCTLQLFNFATNVVITTGAAISKNAWHVVEVSYQASTGASVVRLDGVQVASGTSGTHAITTMTAWYGPMINNLSLLATTIQLDDLALNDSTGAAQNSWCGLGQIVHLIPTADTSRVGFTTGAAGTTSLFACVDNAPPIGVAQASGTATSQIKDNTSNTTDNYVATLQTYTVAGVPSGASIVVLYGMANMGNTSVTVRTNTVATSNPTITATSGSTIATIAGTFPTGWVTFKTAPQYAPSVTLGTAPTLTFTKGTASTDYSMADYLAIQAEYLPAPPGGLTPGLMGHRQPARDQRTGRPASRGRF